MPSTVSLYVAIDDDGSIFKHWALFIDAPHAQDKTVLQALGSAGRFRFESKNADARLYDTLVELFYVCDVDVARMNDVKQIAEQLPIRDSVAGWNCQDYVLDLLKALEGEGLVDGEEEGYRKRWSTLWHKQDGLA
ncbi:hypothetical protein PRK78_003734 [Emydomyces testavorans]|uniref:Uncharacterized protein n=1 Tax=Emydomyces testavorans TaxID=2070801 RepID=A0AAF0DIS4_9EURO|nr:hypothetical protein PRK78_003734 [Emydomyces testavorans]